MADRKCGMCGLPIKETETGVRQFGFYVAHQEYRCIELLQMKIAELEKELAKAKQKEEAA